jgi:solute carrier family 13 (sodium-dependent dicarboxylate transporter), member 2/3/5
MTPSSGPQNAPETPYNAGRWIGLALGPALFAALLALPAPAGLSPEAWRVAAVAVFMAVWWITEAIPVPATALLPIVLFPLLGVGSIADATAPYANPLIYLFLGGFLIALAMERCGLHRRIGLVILRFVGTRPDAIIGGFMIATAGLSMWISNTATTAMMLPVAIALVELVGEGEHTDRRFATALMLGIAYGATLGGIATLIGTPPNALLAAYLGEVHGIEVGFAQWMAVGLPLTLVMLPLAWLLLTRVLFRLERTPIAGGRALIRDELAKLGPMSRAEKMVAGVFLTVALLWMFRPLIAGALPGLHVSDAGIAVAGGLLMFVLPSDFKRSEFLLTWRWAARLPWRVLLLFGGGLSLAAAIERSGLAAWLGGGLVALDTLPTVVLVLGVVALIIFLTELTSNMATTATFLPIIGSLALALDQNPAALAAVCALGASCAFMLPVATPPNAIVFGTGRITIPQMARVGLLLNVLAIAVVGLLGFWLVGRLLGAP